MTEEQFWIWDETFLSGRDIIPQKTEMEGPDRFMHCIGTITRAHVDCTAALGSGSHTIMVIVWSQENFFPRKILQALKKNQCSMSGILLFSQTIITLFSDIQIDVPQPEYGIELLSPFCQNIAGLGSSFLLLRRANTVGHNHQWPQKLVRAPKKPQRQYL